MGAPPLVDACAEVSGDVLGVFEAGVVVGDRDPICKLPDVASHGVALALVASSPRSENAVQPSAGGRENSSIVQRAFECRGCVREVHDDKRRLMKNLEPTGRRRQARE